METLFQFPGCQAGERRRGGAGAETGSRAIAGTNWVQTAAKRTDQATLKRV